MMIHTLGRKKATLTAAAALAGMFLFSACGGSHSPVDLSAMTAEEQEQLAQELTETLESNGVKLLMLYSDEMIEGDGETEDTEEEPRQQRYFAVSVRIERDEPQEEGIIAGTVHYDIYDLAEGLPKKSTNPMQQLSAEEYSSFLDQIPCEIQDLNFDGAQDLYLWLWSGAQNAQGKFFLWNEEQGQFVENEALGDMVSPMAVEDYQIIQSYVHISASEYETTLYGWEGEEPVPLRRIVQRAPGEQSLQGEVYDWDEDHWELMYERKVVFNLDENGQRTMDDSDKEEDLMLEMREYYDPQYEGW